METIVLNTMNETIEIRKLQLNYKNLPVKKILTLALFFLSFVCLAQHDDGKKIKTTYYFKVDNVSSISQLEEMRDEITSLNGVTEFKPEFKAEKQVGQLIIIVFEKKQTSEGEKDLFSPVFVKKIIIRHNLAPAGFQSEKEN